MKKKRPAARSKPPGKTTRKGRILAAARAATRKKPPGSRTAKRKALVRSGPAATKPKPKKLSPVTAKTRAPSKKVSVRAPRKQHAAKRVKSPQAKATLPRLATDVGPGAPPPVPLALSLKPSSQADKPALRKPTPARSAPKKSRRRTRPQVLKTTQPAKTSLPDKPVTSGEKVKPLPVPSEEQPQVASGTKPVTTAIPQPTTNQDAVVSEKPVKVKTSEVPFYIPPILLEGDEPWAPARVTPAQVTDQLRNVPPFESNAQPQTLPPVAEAHGPPEPSMRSEPSSASLLLAARDPHSLYAQWQLATEYQRDCLSQSASGRLVLKIFRVGQHLEPAVELSLHPDTQNSFIPVDAAGADYEAELGYYDLHGAWASVAQSNPVRTPPDKMSEDRAVILALFTKLESQPTAIVSVPVVPSQAQPEVDLLPSAPELPSREAQKPFDSSGQQAEAPRLTGRIASEWVESHTKQIAEQVPGQFGSIPPRAAAAAPPLLQAQPLSPRQEAALLEMIYRWTETAGAKIGSAVEGQFLRIKLPPGAPLPSSAELAQGGGPGVPAPTALLELISSLALAAPGKVVQEQPHAFWLNVNAELVIYGATEPTAQLSIAGRRANLRPDGTFSYRFALPDGAYELRVEAISSRQEEKHVTLNFGRATEAGDSVGVHPQDPGLQPPVAGAISDIEMP